MPAPKGHKFNLKPPNQRKTERLYVNFTKTDAERIKKHLETIGMQWTEYAREVVLEAVRNEGG